jgi:Rieske Fe-S protein
MKSHSRRDFMKVVTSYLLGVTGVLGIAGVARFLAFESAPMRQTVFDLGPASDFPLNSRTRLDSIPALLIRNESAYVALSLLCTHLGCTVEGAPEGFVCPCHGSRYDAQGAVQRGPAADPLRHLRVEIMADGRLTLYTA